MLGRLIPLFGTGVIAVAAVAMVVALVRTPFAPATTLTIAILVVALGVFLVATWLWATNSSVRRDKLSPWWALKGTRPLDDPDLQAAWRWGRLAWLCWAAILGCLAIIAGLIATGNVR